MSDKKNVHPTLAQLLDGYGQFFKTYFKEGTKSLAYSQLAEGQSPKVLVVGCSDSRVDPAILTQAGLGEIFVIRNVANLVPPYQPDSSTYHGTSAALEFAVRELKVEHVLVIGHSRCAGIQALLHDSCTPKYTFVHGWVHIADEARERALSSGLDGEALGQYCEEEALKVSIRNLESFPWIRERLANNTLHLHAWHFNIKDGNLRILRENGQFESALSN